MNPMINSLHAAAERLTKDGCLREDDDAVTVGEFVAGLTDPEPITEDWLKSVGFVGNDVRRFDLKPFGPLGNCLSWINPTWNDIWNGEVVYDGNRMPKPLSTRGAVRAFLFGLGIDLGA